MRRVIRKRPILPILHQLGPQEIFPHLFDQNCHGFTIELEVWFERYLVRFLDLTIH